MKAILPIALLCASVLFIGGSPVHAGDCGAGAKPMPVAQKDIVDTAVGAGSFNTLVAAVKAAGLVDTLKGEGPFTVFAPTDDAFAALPAGTVEGLLKDKAALTKILTYHVVPGRVAAADVVKLNFAETVNGQAVRIQTSGSNVMIDGAKVVQADIKTSNGIIHVIDKVILPRKDIVDTAVEAGAFKTLVTAVKAAGLVDTLKSKGPFTVFAPVDAAFAKLPEGTIPALLKDKAQLTAVLTYHVIPGRVLSGDLKVGTIEVATVQGSKLRIEKKRDGSVFVDGAQVKTADVVTGNGIIHIIDSVVLPNANQQ
ncbi:MAG: fasciclin domain-containing protein [Planctomycetota bacterium]|nr:fasciclin domain-containing protein [Planctomycetota bacterium]